MNAPAPKDLLARMAAASFELMPLTAIAPSETHIQQLRRKRYDMESLADLRSSIAKLGVQQPVVVRKLKALRGLAAYELVAGERRFKAAGLAGLAHLPAVIRELTDEEVLEVQLVENLQREDLHPLEEAAGYEELMKVAKLKKEELGDKVGKSRSWVYSRLDLLKLPAAGKEALQRGEIDVSRALIVANIKDPVAQMQMLERAQMRDDDRPTWSVRDLREELGQRRITVHLRTATFATDDETFHTFGPKYKVGGNSVEDPVFLPSCATCPERSGNKDPGAEDPNVCLDPSCFDTKAKITIERRRDQAVKSGRAIVAGEEAKKIAPSKRELVGHIDLDEICEDDEFPEPEPKSTGDDEKDQAAYDAWDEKSAAWQPRTYRQLLAGKNLKDTVLLETKKGSPLRELLPVKTARQLLKEKGVTLAPSVGQKKPPARPRYDWKAEQAKQEAANRKRAEEEKRVLAFRRKILAAVFPKATGALTSEELHLIAAELASDWKVGEVLALAYGKKPAIGNLKDAELARLIRIALYAGSAVSGHTNPKPLLSLAKRCKVDVAKLQREHEAAENSTTKGTKK